MCRTSLCGGQCCFRATVIHRSGTWFSSLTKGTIWIFRNKAFEKVKYSKMKGLDCIFISNGKVNNGLGISGAWHLNFFEVSKTKSGFF